MENSGGQMTKILLVEDDEAIREGLSFSFQQSGYQFLTAKNIREAGAIATSEGPSLVLLDVFLPDGNGFSFYQTHLAEKKIPTIFLTARDDENDIVNGLELGAEDYITKPFSIKELMARVNRVMLRQKQSNILKVQDVTFDLDRMEVKKAGEVLSFSNLEIKLLRLMFENRNRVVTRNAIIDCIWDATGNDVYDHTATVYVQRIRQKLGPGVIQTVKGIGYRVDVEE